MQIVLVPLRSYGGPFGGFTEDPARNYYSAVTEQIKLVIARNGFPATVTVSPYGIGVEGEDLPRTFTFHKWEQKEEASDAEGRAFFHNECHGAHFIFIRGGRWIEIFPFLRFQVHLYRFLPNATPVSAVITDVMEQVLKRQVSYTVLDPVVRVDRALGSVDRQWVLLFCAEGPLGWSEDAERRNHELCQDVVQKGGVESLNRKNDRLMAQVIAPFRKAALTVSMEKELEASALETDGEDDENDRAPVRSRLPTAAAAAAQACEDKTRLRSSVPAGEVTPPPLVLPRATAAASEAVRPEGLPPAPGGDGTPERLVDPGAGASATSSSQNTPPLAAAWSPKEEGDHAQRRTSVVVQKEKPNAWCCC